MRAEQRKESDMVSDFVFQFLYSRSLGERVRASTHCIWRIVSFCTCVRARGVCHVSLAAKFPLGSHLLSFRLEGVLLGFVWFPPYFPGGFSKGASQDILPREIFKRDVQESFPRYFPRGIAIQSPWWNFPKRFTRYFPKRFYQERSPR